MTPTRPIDDIPDNGCLGVEVGADAVLLHRRGATVTALDGICPHQGAPLADGAIADGLVVCPYHHAVFELADGRRRHGPGLGDLRRRAVELRDGVVHVGEPEPEPTVARNAQAPRIVIVGAGAAGLACAVALRGLGHAGPLVLIDAEADPLYERTDQSKSALDGSSPDGTPPRIDAAALDRLAIERRFGERIAAIDAEGRVARFESGEALEYDLCLAAPGAAARSLDLPGATLGGVETLRSAEDAARIAAAAASGARCAVVGGGFIGMEAAASLAQAGAEVTLLMREASPGAWHVGEDISEMIAAHLRSLGVRLRAEARIAGFEGEEGRLVAVRTGDGAAEPVDLALVAVGETRLGALAGPAEEDGAALADASLGIAPGLWAAGDAAAREGARTRHWRAAEEEGRRAAADMLGLPPPPEPVPFFWTQIGGPPDMVGLHMVGRVDPSLDVEDVGSIAENDFTRYHIDGERVVGATGSGGLDATAALHLALIRSGPVPRRALEAAGWDPAAL